MKTIIENDVLLVRSETAGAQLLGITAKADAGEYLWSGDPKYWARTAPILFPAVGTSAGGIRVDGQSYPLKQHGFARDSEFTLSAVSPTSVTYTLTDSDSTRKVYPYHFALDIRYTLDGNALTVGHRVTNTGDRDLWFQLGAHPAFLCPLDQGFALDQYQIRFDRVQTLRRRFLNPATSLVDGRSAIVLDNADTLALDEHIFDDGALIFDDIACDAITLAALGNRKPVTVRFAGRMGEQHPQGVTSPGWPMLGLWAPPGAPFVCIEPWFGRADDEGFEGDISEKKGVRRLAAGENFECEYQIVIGG